MGSPEMMTPDEIKKIDIRGIKEESIKFPEPLKSMIQMQKDFLSSDDFIEFFITIRHKARELDANKNNEELK